MKILQILPSLEVGGVERGVIDLVRGLQKRGQDSVVISSGGELVKELQKMGIPHYTLPVHSKSLASLSLIPKIAEIIRNEGVDIVHGRSRVPAWLAYFAAKQTGAAFVTTCHGYYSNHFLSRIMGWGRRVIVISRVIGRHMIDDFGVPPEHLRLIHRGVDLSQFDGASPAEPVPASEKKVFRIVNIGRLSPIKGQVEFIQAIHLLRCKIPNIEAWIVGSEIKGKTKYTDEIKKTIERLGLQNCVKLLGTRRDIPEVLRKSDLLVLSTLVPEAFGRVIVEAGAVGTPVIATRLGGVLDIIDHGENGLLVTPGDVEETAAAMAQILSQPERARKFAEKLQAKVRKHFSLEHMVQQTMAVYEEIRQEKKILVIKLGAMGDLILITPSLRMLREKYPKAHIALVVDKKLTMLVEHCPYLNEIIPVDRSQLSHPGYLLRLGKKLRTEGFDYSVDFQNSKWTHLLAFLGGVTKRYGFARGKFGFLVNCPDRTFDTPDAPVKHQFRILSKLGVHDFHEALELWPAPDTEKKIEALLEEHAAEAYEFRVGLVVGSSPKWPTKRWPMESFHHLAQRLIRELGCQIYLIGGPEDRGIAETYFPPDTDGVVNLIGRTSLQELVSAVKAMHVLVTGDTAPLHVASAVKTKIVALFGPTDPKRHMPPGPAAVLNRSLPCAPCYSGVCKNPENMACLKKVSVNEVFESVRRALGVTAQGTVHS